MKISLSWLKEILALDEPAEQIAERLTLAGLEVDSVEPAPLSFTGVVVGEVLECQKHPDADKLAIAQVSDGSERVQVVCAAPNCRPGIKVAFAKEGARLENGSFKIKRGKLRGVESRGMLCAWTELDLGAEDGGIAELSKDAKLGRPLAEIFGDTILEISLTPNLGHCQSVLGVARELSAATGASITLPQPKVTEKGTNPVQVEIADPEACPAYACRVMRSVKVGPSPQAIVRRLEACGMRSVNNVVDATNLIMLELGHPLHAFDLSKVVGEKIVVHSDTICDAEKQIAFAGVKGDANSEVSEATTDLLLEAAFFDPAAIRRSSKKLQLITEASRRFERGTDPNMIQTALDRAALLIQELAGGEVAGTVRAGQTDFPRHTVAGRCSRINQVLGTKLSLHEVEQLLTRLDFLFTADDDDQFHVAIPTYRFDMHGEIDLVEETGRLYGYQNIERKPPSYRSTDIPHTPLYLFEQKVRAQLIGSGLQEMVTSNLISPEEAAISPLPESAWVRVINAPHDHSIVCPTLLPGLLKAIRHNQHHGNPNIAAFEIGPVHFRNGDDYQEQPVAAIVLADSTSDFLDLKGIVETLAPGTTFTPSSLALLHPGRQAEVHSGEMELGVLGQVHPATLRRFDIKGDVLFATLNLNALMSCAQETPQFTPLPQFPASERDWTLTLREATTHQQLLDAIHAVPSRLLKKVTLLDIYRGSQVGEGWKNATYRFTYRDEKKTLAIKSVESEHTRITQGVLAALKKEVRSPS